GGSAALSSDGNTALVGGPADDDEAGAAWVFTRSGAAWAQQGAKLTGGGGSGGRDVGLSAAPLSDGHSALLGPPLDDGDAGAAWQFARSDGAWSQQGPKLTASDETDGAEFGTGVALAGNGNAALIGGSGDDDGLGAAWAFAFTAPGAPTGVTA